MKDILYIVGQQDESKDADLRLSLRMLARHGRNVGRVIVAGYPPAWLSDDVVKVPVADDPSAGYKHVNILNAIFKAIDAAHITGDFIYSSDDHFITSDFDADEWPVFTRGRAIRTAEDYGGIASGDFYKWSVVHTRKLLERRGYPFDAYACHANTHMNADDAAEVKALVESAENDISAYGFEPTELFMNVRAKHGIIDACVRKDVKLSRYESARMTGPFSVNDFIWIDQRWLDWRSKNYTERCKYEKAPPKTAFAYFAEGDVYKRLAKISQKSLRAYVPDAEIVELDRADVRAAFPSVSESLLPYVARLAIPLMKRFDGYARVIWVDCDIVVKMKKFASLTSVAFEGREVAAVRDPNAGACLRRAFGAISGDDVYGLRASLVADAAADRYANTGLLVFNLPAIDRISWSARLEKAVALNAKYVFPLRDQDMFFTMCDFTELPKEFNVFRVYLDRFAGDPVTIHYTGPGGTWTKQEMLKLEAK